MDLHFLPPRMSIDLPLLMVTVGQLTYFMASEARQTSTKMEAKGRRKLASFLMANEGRRMQEEIIGGDYVGGTTLVYIRLLGGSPSRIYAGLGAGSLSSSSLVNKLFFGLCFGDSYLFLIKERRNIWC